MSLLQLRRELKELKNSIKPKNHVKIFILHENGFTAEGESEEDIDAWGAAHPEAPVFKLRCKSFREDGL
jgi:hypothetical protein